MLLVICDSLISCIIKLVKGVFDFKCDKRNTQIYFNELKMYTTTHIKISYMGIICDVCRIGNLSNHL